MRWGQVGWIYSDELPRSSEEVGWSKSGGYKNWDGEDLVGSQLGEGGDDSQHTANQIFKGKQSTYSGWEPEGPGLQTPCAGGGEKDDSNIAPFRTTRLAAFLHLLSNVMRSKSFLSHLIFLCSFYFHLWFFKNAFTLGSWCLYALIVTVLRNHTGMVVPCAFHSCWRLFVFDQIQLDAYCTVVKTILVEK